MSQEAALVDRGDRGVLRLNGAERRSYLQGLLTNDIASLGEGAGCYAAYLTPQGRMIADMRVFETGESILCDLDRTLAREVAERWSQFVFSEDVEVRDISEETVEIGIYGPRAARVLSQAGLGSEEGLDGMRLYGNRRADAAVIVRSDEVGVSGFDVIAPVGLKEELTARLIECGAVAVAPEVVEAVRIEAGRPKFLVDMGIDTIPLEAGIEDRAISLTKGCYVGQEVIIRVLHRGHGRVARRLVRLGFESPGPVPERGAAVVSGEREIGAITSAAVSFSTGRPVALGYVHRDFAAPGTTVTVRLGGELAQALVA